MEQYANALINETSPYLLQHAYNPVNWVPWSKDVFERAKEEDKLVLISVGYSACHWCHVMEHESFEDEKVAELMNLHFICVKVDREERPDVDQIYMTAVQLMTQKGGWPLNCFTLPDGRPVFGGTYFPKEQWMHVLRSLEHTYRSDRQRTLEYAHTLAEGVQKSELIDKPVTGIQFSSEKLHELVFRWSRNFDRMEGGGTRAPKFPLPNNLDFLLYYAERYQDQKVKDHVELTLDKMAMGGMYDQIGGGFARYSVDMLWKVPHFEKMLYDNAQLLHTYASAYKLFQKPLYKRVIYQTIEWIERELLSKDGALFSALDADSEGEEGKFYCWTEQELKKVLGKDFDWVKRFYSVDQCGYWEEQEAYILLRRITDEAWIRNEGVSREMLEEKLKNINERLLSERSHRVRPGTDTKKLTSWNAMAIKGLCTCYAVFQEDEFLHHAQRILRWLESSQISEEGTVYRSSDEKGKKILGFLEDYVHLCEAYLSFYSVTYDVSFLQKADRLAEKTLELFGDPVSQMCFFTTADTELIARKMELNDNVIPAGNSVMGNVLFDLGHFMGKTEFIERALQMLSNLYEGMEQYGSGYSNWAILLLKKTGPFMQLVLTGNNAQDKAAVLNQHYLPDVQLAVKSKGLFPLIEGKGREGQLSYYLCADGTCSLPFDRWEDVIPTILQYRQRGNSYS
jgi:uncharacterized protein YyaL (SSP411 family)